ncbi:hypothetical protein BDR04DRAFT_1085757 [Suillus decipiens]|nr:hypothetical protein BDR04DRAFT_1085757 [Suillus decipiens]
MVLERTLSRKEHDRLDSNIHVTNKTIFRPGISTRGTGRAMWIARKMTEALLSQAAWQHDNVECWENETCIESKSTALKCDPALEKELVEVYFAGSVAPELAIE